MFSPEFRNRLDSIIPFDSLSPKVIKTVVDKFLVEIQVQLDSKKVVLEISDEARDWLTFVEAQIARIAGLAGEDGDNLPALEKIAAYPQINRMLQKRAAAQAGPSIPQDEKSKLPARLRDVPPKLIPRRYLSADGLEIWVGRSDEGNDHLSTRLARGKDLFFHVDGAPGSHVILRTDGRDDPPSESLLDDPCRSLRGFA